MTKEVFFITAILNPSQIQHLSEDAARGEAEKVALGNPGTSVHVFKSLATYKAGKMQVEEHVDFLYGERDFEDSKDFESSKF